MGDEVLPWTIHTMLPWLAFSQGEGRALGMEPILHIYADYQVQPLPKEPSVAMLHGGCLGVDEAKGQNISEAHGVTFVTRVQTTFGGTPSGPSASRTPLVGFNIFFRSGGHVEEAGFGAP